MDVVVTGIGVISSVGNDKESFWNSILNGTSGLKKMEQYDSSELITDFAGEVRDFHPDKMFYETERCAQLFLNAALEALEHSGLERDDYESSQKGIVLGTSLGGMLNGEAFHRQWIHEGLEEAERELLLSYPIHSPADFLSIRFNLKGPKVTISTACAAGSNAIGYGADLIRCGKADMMLVGGGDPLSLLSLSGFNSLKAMSDEPCSPYSDSKGITIAEGSGIFVIERLDKALKRGATILATIKGYGLSSDAYHPTAPNPGGSGAYQSMSAALKQADISIEQVGYINGHGTGTRANDNAETTAIKNLFGSLAVKLPISSTKSMIGHTLGAAGAIEGIACVMALNEQLLPPTINVDEGKNPYGLDFVPNQAKSHPFNTVISNSFAFGGNNASIVFEKFNGGKAREPGLDRTVKKERVVITGFGNVIPLGVGKVELWESLTTNKHGLSEISFSDNVYKGRVGAIPSERSYRKLINPKEIRRLDLISKLGMASSKLAIDHSGLKINRENSERIGVVFGTTSGPMETVEKINRSIIENGPGKTNPSLFPNTVMNAAAGHICLNYQIKGPSTTICSGGVAGSQALIYAYQLIQEGILDAALVVTGDEYHEVIHAGYDRCHVLSNKPSPFESTSSGFALSGGSTTIVLESESYAQKRNANIHAEIKGYGMSSDAYRIAGNHPSGKDYAVAIKSALEESELSWDDIHGIYSDARGLPLVDMCEANAIKRSGGLDTPVTTLSHKNGYTMGGLTPLHIISAIYSMETKKMPALNVETPVSDLRFASDNEMDQADNFIINSSAFGGGYTSVVVGRYV